RPGQKDSDTIPPYDELDPIIEAVISAESRVPAGDLGPRAEEVRTRIFRAEFKRRQEPQPLYVSQRPFGRAWSVPLAGRFRLPE
ncbi:MAG: NAD+ synthase, partial [Desulfovibrio sp.]|nr:NAD+ synthase [Desulfovibrio sp.]